MENSLRRRKIVNRWIEPLIRHELLFTILSSLFAIILGLIVAGILIKIYGASPFQAFAAIWQGAFGSPYAISVSLNRATPLILIGLGTSLAFRSGVWTIGAEGQMNIGALTATLVAIYLQGLPALIHLPLIIIAGFLGAGVWGCVTGILKAKYKVNEIISSLMMNYIAILLIAWLVRGPIKDPLGFADASQKILPSATLPIIWEGTTLHAGLIIAFITTIILYVVLWRSPFGFQIRTVGMNIKTGRYAGMNVVMIQILATFIGGGLAGIAGASEILGAQFVLRENFLLGFGYDGVVVAVLGQLDPFGVAISSILFGALRAGAGTMQRLVGVPSSIIRVIQGTVVLFVVSIAILRPFLLNRLKKGVENG